MNVNTSKVIRKTVMIMMGAVFCYVGVVTALTGVTTIARQVYK